jgi:hypothetical protein
MRTLRDSKFITIDFDEFNKILKITWKAQTVEMNNDDFKAECWLTPNFLIWVLNT